MVETIYTEQSYLHKLQQLKAGLMGDLLSGMKSPNYDIGDLCDYHDAGKNEKEKS